MNTIKLFSITAICAAVLTSCSIKDEILPNPNNGGQVEVKFASDSISALQTKVQNSLWTGLERIGIFMVENGTTNIMSGVSNREYANPNTSSLASVTFSSSNPICYPLVTTPKVAFIAYYPYKPLTDVWTYPIDVSTQTTQSAIDLMRAVANNSGNGYDNTYSSTVNLHFYHKLSKIIINVTAGDGVTESLAGMSVRITNLPYRGSLNLSADANLVQREATPTGNVAPRTVVDGSQYEAIVIPGGTAGIKFTLTTGSTAYEANIPSPASWESGHKYVYAVTLTKHEADISGTVEDWDGGSPDVPTTGYPGGYPDEAIPTGLYQGEIQLYYSDGTPMTASLASPPEAILRSGTSQGLRLQANGQLPFDVTANKVIKEIVLTDLNPQRTYLIGRHTSSGPLYLNIDASGEMKFRDADAEGFIPIGCFAEFQLINALAGNYKQEADLDLLGETVTPNVEWTPIGNRFGSYFNGTFNGNDKNIDNIYINSTNDYQGLFGYMIGYLCNINIRSGNIKGQDYVGGVVGYTTNGITSCSNGASVEGRRWVGGIVGSMMAYNSIGCYNTYNTGNVSGISRVGGVAGTVGYSMELCYNTGNVSGSDTVGGLVAVNTEPLSNSYNTGNVSGSGRCIGGLAGVNVQFIISSYNAGSVSGVDLIGGITGVNGPGVFVSGIGSCYNTSSVTGTGTGIGGIAGWNGRDYINDGDTTNISACYSTGVVSGAGNVGVIVGTNNYGGGVSKCYYLTGSYGIGGNITSNPEPTPFSSGWPDETEWGPYYNGDSHESGPWQSYGSWNGGVNPIFPKLWWEP
ncbi:MAG: fimbrillin family protein [Tannerellaceae bacterium]|jgi:hypothetical protein|nr:fimbrillin family protein [Tannerellaceae bacterium]